MSAARIYIPTKSVGGFVFFSHPPAFICRLFDDGHSGWCEVIPHCSFDLRFSSNWWCWAFFHVPVVHLCFLSVEVSNLGLLASFWLGCFVFLIVSCLCILKINLLLVPNIFSLLIGCLFSLWFCVEKLVNLIRSHLFIFVFISITLGDGSKKILLLFMSKRILFMFSSGNFIIIWSYI